MSFVIRVVLLLNPEAQTITVHRPNNLIATLVSSQTLTLPELLPGWELLTSPVYINTVQLSPKV